MNDDIKKIEWPDIKKLQNSARMARGFLAVRRLCGMGRATEWIEGRRAVGDLYTKMPHRYEISWWSVRFQPHWDHIAVERGPNLPTSASARTILATIERLKATMPMK